MRSETLLVIQEMADGQRRVVAQADIPPGTQVLVVSGRVHRTQHQHTLQVGAEAYLEAEESRSMWPYLDHSCRPNAAFRGLSLWTIGAVAAGEPLTFDYNSTEWSITTPFLCHCPAHPEPRAIRGYRHLSKREREAVQPWTAPYLLQRADLGQDN